ncbi:hypothetical protein DR999_PMT12850 [Platysternon megacephalum]|uniref:Uncharacterized protein n=1 Tax=Platysternon megacephalum TaxID=55544 RepID=A0A4D9EA11_9SAUR|nr:hypothetical protein DR999_PMT12850 [Platysternon megacephalum]
MKSAPERCWSQQEKNRLWATRSHVPFITPPVPTGDSSQGRAHSGVASTHPWEAAQPAAEPVHAQPPCVTPDAQPAPPTGSPQESHFPLLQPPTPEALKPLQPQVNPG